MYILSEVLLTNKGFQNYIFQYFLLQYRPKTLSAFLKVAFSEHTDLEKI